MKIIRKVVCAVQRTLGQLARQVGAESGVIVRQRKFTADSLAQTLALGYLQNPCARDEQLARIAALLGVVVTPQAVAQRFTWTLARFLRRLFEETVRQAIAAPPAAIPLLQRFTGVYVQDSTTIALPQGWGDDFPGCGGNGAEAALKVQVRLELLTGQLEYVAIEPGRIPDQNSLVQQTPLPRGALRLADLGYFCVKTLARLAEQESYWISRIQSETAIRWDDGTPLDLHHWLQTNVTDAPVEISIRLGAGAQLPCRLLAIPVPPEVVARRRRRLQRDAQRKGRSLSNRRLAWCRWTVLVTNVEADRLTLNEAIVLYRVRWQIELLFKLWKSRGQVAAVTSAQPARQAVEVFARLLAVVIQHWLLQASVWSIPDRSLTKASQSLRTYAATIAANLRSTGRLCCLLEQIARSLAKTARLNRRRKKPNHSQLLLSPEKLEYLLT